MYNLYFSNKFSYDIVGYIERKVVADNNKLIAFAFNLWAGMVASCAGCNDMAPWSAMLIGIIAGIIFTFSRLLVLKLQIDDPLDAISVHVGGGKQNAKPSPADGRSCRRHNGAGGL